MRNFNFLVYLIFITVLVSCTSKNNEKQSRVEFLPYYSEASFTPKWIDLSSQELDTLHKIPNFQLVNQDGDTISQDTFKDKIYVTDFFFTSCSGICPKMTKNMKLLQDEFIEDEDVLFLSHSVTPKKDSVPILKNYAVNHDIISSKWHLATGNQELIYHLGRKKYFVEEDLGLDKASTDFLHTENFILVDKRKHIRGIYNGLNKTSIQQLIADIKTLSKE